MTNIQSPKVVFLPHSPCLSTFLILSLDMWAGAQLLKWPCCMLIALLGKAKELPLKGIAPLAANLKYLTFNFCNLGWEHSHLVFQLSSTERIH